MKKILTLPTWQIFILLILPAFFSELPMGLVLTAIYISFLGYCVYFLGKNLYKKLPIDHDLKIRYFTFCLFFSLVYVIVVALALDGGYEINQDNYKTFGWALFIILPLHAFTIFCIFYVIRFIAKAIATIANKKIVGPNSYIGDILLLWFFPLGIWWVHPKVRKIFS